MTGAKPIGDESGTTLVELMVGLAAGMVVLMALTLTIIVTLHGSARVSARVEATQQARLVVTRVMEELHSACVAPKVTPVLPESTGTSLSFIHAEGEEKAAVAPTPTKTVITLENGSLFRTDYEATGALPTTGGAAPRWTFAETGTTRKLLDNVAPIAPSSSIFGYYRYLDGSLSSTPQATPLEEGALETIQVQVALNAAPGRTPVADAGADAGVRDSAVLRLTPPSYNETTAVLPCQ